MMVFRHRDIGQYAKYQVGNQQHREQQKTNEYEGQYRRSNERNQHGDLEIERFLALLVDECRLVLLDQPDDQRTYETGNDDEQVRQDRQIAIIRAGGLSYWLNGLIHDVIPLINSEKRQASVYPDCGKGLLTA